MENRGQGRMGQRVSGGPKTMQVRVVRGVGPRGKDGKWGMYSIRGVRKARVMDRVRWRRGGKSKGEDRKRRGHGVMRTNVVWARAG